MIEPRDGICLVCGEHTDPDDPCCGTSVWVEGNIESNGEADTNE